MFTINGNFIDIYHDLRGVQVITEDENIIPITGNENMLDSLIKGGNIHKMVRKKIQPLLKPGISMNYLANVIESTTKELTNNIGINKGIGFPPGLSINNCAAHFSPYKDKDIILGNNDNVKIDFGVEVNGWIVDSAFTIGFNPQYDNLLKAVQEATYTGIKNAGMDVIIKEWSKDIQEVMESYEVEINGKNKQIQVISNLGGHNIILKKIHGGVFLPAKYISYYPLNLRFQEGVYAIETFGSTESSWVNEKKDELSLYAINNTNFNKLKNKKAKRLAQKIIKQFQTLPFSERYIEHIPNCRSLLLNLVDNNILTAYPPLYDNNNGMTAQYEHTIVLSDNKKTIISQNDDY